MDKDFCVRRLITGEAYSAAGTTCIATRSGLAK